MHICKGLQKEAAAVWKVEMCVLPTKGIPFISIFNQSSIYLLLVLHVHYKIIYRHGYSGSNYDKYVERTDKSTVHKIKETFWTTKQAVIQKLGKKEDEHVVASDAALDAKLEVGTSSWL